MREMTLSEQQVRKMNLAAAWRIDCRGAMLEAGKPVRNGLWLLVLEHEHFLAIKLILPTISHSIYSALQYNSSVFYSKKSPRKPQYWSSRCKRKILKKESLKRGKIWRLTTYQGNNLLNREICIRELAFFSSKIAGLFNFSKRQFINISHIDEHFFPRLLNNPKLQ